VDVGRTVSPELPQNVIDFNGRTGYVCTAIDVGVPIVSIGGQETQLFLTRGTGRAKRVGIIKRLMRSEMVPIAAGFPFGLTSAAQTCRCRARSSLRYSP
jgi:hypothetical protein